MVTDGSCSPSHGGHAAYNDWPLQFQFASVHLTPPVSFMSDQFSHPVSTLELS